MLRQTTYNRIPKVEKEVNNHNFYIPNNGIL
jgi:hypothetical protein